MNQSELLVKDIINKLYPDFKAIHIELDEYQIRGSLTVSSEIAGLTYQDSIKFIGYDYKSQQWVKIED